MKNRKLFLLSMIVALLAAVLPLLTCASNPLTGQSTMALVSNSELFPASFAEYKQFLAENKVISGTADALMVDRLGKNIRTAAEKWLASQGHSDYLKDYEWEYHLVDSDEVNAWCMPGGKIVVYTGILPVTQTEDALATVMGHEVAHALLNHGQQRMSAGVLQELGATAVGSVFSDNTAIMAAYGIGSEVGGMLPY